MSEDVHPLLVKAGDLLKSGEIEGAMDTLAEFFREDAKSTDNPTVQALLQSCQESACSIGFEWYASLK